MPETKTSDGRLLFQLELVVGGEQLLFKGGEAGFIWPGYLSTPPQVHYQLSFFHAVRVSLRTHHHSRYSTYFTTY